ncbi:MAG: metallophosphoesterase [Opitutales bacterium]|nr:metallophosphoesterase [Opitutales bacterium]
MKIVLLGDLHFISPADPDCERRERRRHFAEAWPSFERVISWVDAESPDLVVSVGDIVDWYSDENRDFALERLESLNTPWILTPGNHDFAPGGEDSVPQKGLPEPEEIRKKWEDCGVALGNRSVDADGAQLLLVDSHNSGVPEGTRDWLRRKTDNSMRNVVITHVPLNVPSMSDYILSIEPHRDLKKYVQSGAPDLFEASLRGRVEAVFSGHLHFPGKVSVEGTDMYLLPLSIHAFEKSYPGEGSICVLDTKAKDGARVRMLKEGRH